MVRNRYNTTGIIKYPFWRMTAENPRAVYACVNYGEAVCPEEIAGRSIVVNADIGEAVSALLDEADCSDDQMNCNIKGMFFMTCTLLQNPNKLHAAPELYGQPR